MMERDLESAILDCFEGTEWHLSLWFPKVARAVMRLPAAASDGEVQECVMRMLDQGVLETGTVEGADFQPCPADLRSPRAVDLYLRQAVAAGVEQ